MRFRWWNNIGLSGRTAILMIIPMMLVILALGYYVTANKISSAERNAEQRGSLLARHLSSIVELGMVAQDEVVLSSYADIILKEEGVKNVSMQNMEGNVLVEKNVDKSVGSRLTVKYYSSPVLLTEIAVGGIENDLDESVEIDNKLVGSVRIGILSEKASSKQERILLLGLTSTLLGIIISALIGYRLSQLITRPILRLNKTVSLLTKGELSARADEKSEAEIGALEQGINNMAESLFQSQSNLQSKVDKATANLSISIGKLERKNIELVKSREEAIKLGDEKVQLLARISHELRTPLNSVIGFSRLLEKKISDRDRLEYTQTIINSATQLTSVIDDVLLFSKLEFGSLSLEKTIFSPREVCEDTVVMIAPAAQEKNIELVLRVNNAVPDFMEGDPLRIKQVLTNLINNAIKFTDAGEIVVDVILQSSSSDDSDAQLSITVTDTGCGINLEKFDTLFNEFAQAENIRTRKFDGIGLGLSISRRLARAMGGDITVSSQERVGSCFCFAIPLLNPRNEKRLTSAYKQLSGKRVLLFEPHLKSRQALQTMLQKFDMNVSMADNKSDMLDRLKSHKNENTLDILVLAFSAEQLKQIKCEVIMSEFRELFDEPVLILTGMSLWDIDIDSADREKFLCLSKPVKKHALYQNLLTLLKIENKFNDRHHSYEVGSWLTDKIALIVEDNKFNQVLLKTMLENRAAKVKIVNNGEEAIAITRDEKFDVIFMDLHMPGEDGISISHIIRESESSNASTPIILVTADVLFDKQALIDENIINNILHKPIHENKLDESLKNAIKGYSCEQSENIEVSGERGADNHAVNKLNEDLKKEILRLCEEITDSVNKGNKKSAKESLHQLIGLSGYYQLKEVSHAVTLLQSLVNSDNKTDALSQLEKIKRLVNK